MPLRYLNVPPVNCASDSPEAFKGRDTHLGQVGLPGLQDTHGPAGHVQIADSKKRSITCLSEI